MLMEARHAARSPRIASCPSLDPQVVHLLDAARRHGAPPADPLGQPLAVARAAAERHYAFLGGLPSAVARIETMTIEGPAGPLALRVYRPRLDAGLPVLVWFHGGGFALNSLDTHDALFRLLAWRSGAAVCAVAYSKAPEHRYPTQIAEAAAALGWLAANGAGLGLDTARMAVGGDSAGANLALAAALEARDGGGPRIAFGVLLYGMFAADFDTDSHRRFGDGRFGLSTARMRWYWRQYLGGAAPDARAAPLDAGLAGLPPLLLVGAGVDCLLDDTLRLAQRLEASGVPHRLQVHPGLPHAFAQMAGAVAAADDAVWDIAEAVGEALDPLARTP